MTYRTSFSRIESRHQCPRRRFLGHDYKGQGLELIRVDTPLVTGSCVHKGIERLLLGDSVDLAVVAALEVYRQDLEDRGLNLSQMEDPYEVGLEQMNLTEGLIRTWAKRRLPLILELFDVIQPEWEFEIPWPISGSNEHPGLLLIGRADAVLREKSTGDIHILSLKTKKTWDSRSGDAARTMMQGITETLGVEKKIGPVGGVILDVLLTGLRREHPKGSGRYISDNFLVHPWIKRGITSSDHEFAHSYEWTDVEGGHRLGKGWERTDIYQVMTMAEWVDILDSGSTHHAFGESPLDNLIITPPPYIRNPVHMGDFLEQNQMDELRIAGIHTENVDIGDRKLLNAMFPQYPHSCSYPRQCRFWDICWGPLGDGPPEETGVYRLRKRRT